MRFEEHVKKLRVELEVEPLLLVDVDARNYLNQKRYKGYNGLFKSETNTVFVKQSNKILTLAHEMRHAWQYKNRIKENFDFSDNKTVISKLIEKLTYPFSRKEWDANLYAFRYGFRQGLRKDAILYFLSMPIFGLIYGFVTFAICTFLAFSLYNY